MTELELKKLKRLAYEMEMDSMRIDKISFILSHSDNLENTERIPSIHEWVRLFKNQRKIRQILYTLLSEEIEEYNKDLEQKTLEGIISNIYLED